MQEVTIKQRSVFLHYVHVESPGKELSWNFYTRKKNVSFGLFRQTDIPLSPKKARDASAEGGSTSPLISTLQLNSPLFITPLGSVPMSRISLASSNSSDPRLSTGSRSKGLKNNPEPPGCISILPIAHYDSSKDTIKGSYFIQEPGTYVLVFDNTFSVKTPKKLFFFVRLRDIEPKDIVDRKEIEGWILKKGKLKMQGYQRRWVEVHSSGIMTYFRAPGGQSHGSVNLMSSAIRMNHDHFLIDVDANQHTLHFKVETSQEFDRWTSLFEKISQTLEKAALENIKGSESNNLDFYGDIGGSSYASLARSSSSLNLNSMQEKVSSISALLHSELSKMKELIDASKGRIDSKSQWKDFTSILAKMYDNTSTMISSASQLEEQMKTMISNFKSQREKAAHSHHLSDIAFRACLADNNKLRQKFGLDLVSATKFYSQPDYMLNSEIASVISSSYNREEEFFDAEEGEADSEVSSDYSYHIEEDSDDPSKYGSIVAVSLDETSTQRKEADSASNSPSKNTQNSSSTTPTPPRDRSIVQNRRTKLPVPSGSMENISIMGILRNNVGKDLSTVTMPIALNEPIGILQKLCEELEYCPLLDKASTLDDPVDRLAVIAGFVVSGFSSTIHRAARKPFNPLLGETFEFDRPDLGFRYISEKVSHHPVIMACHTTSKNYTFYQDSLLRTKFWGKSMEISNEGVVHLEFPAINEHYIWQKVTTSMRNLFSTSRYLEHHGTVIIKSKLTGHYCELLFKESGYFSSANNEVVGGVYNSKGVKLVSLGGRWDHSIAKFSDKTPDNLEVVWRANPFPSNYAENYGFTQFAIELNELTSEMQNGLPKTDTRYRPDQRMYEEGRYEAAEQEKERLEQKQRATRRRLEANNETWKPRYFQKEQDADSESGYSWVYRPSSENEEIMDYDIFS